MDNITLKDIGRILILIECKNFSNASKILNINSSTLKRTVKIVECKLSKKFFISEGKTISLTKEAEIFYKKHALVFNDYKNNFNLLNKKNSDEKKIIKITCQTELAAFFSKKFFENDYQNYKVYFEVFSLFEIQNSNPKAIFSLYDDYDIIISDNQIPSINNFNWNQSLHKQIKSKLYAHKAYIKSNSPITLENVHTHEILSSNIENNYKLTLMDSDNIAKNINISSNISSDNILTNAALIESKLGIAILPSYLQSEICSKQIVEVLPKYHLANNSINIYSKTDLNIEKKQILQRFISSVKKDI